MNKHFLKTLKRVCRDVEKLADRAPGAVFGLICDAHTLLEQAVNAADPQPAPPANPTMETHFEQEPQS